MVLLSDILNKNLVKGQIGIEIEVEGDRLPNAPTGWHAKADGSLRGGVEYVFRQPETFTTANKRLEDLWDSFEKEKAALDFNERTSIHVHINCLDLTPVQYISFICTYLSIEDLLMKYCGDTRNGNMFCLSASNAEYLMDIILGLAEQGDKMNFESVRRDNLKYSGLNIAATRDYGSLEFRGMRGTTDLDTIKTWVDSLMAIKEFSKGIKHPTEIPEMFSMYGPEEFCNKILQENNFKVITKGVKDIGEILWEGIRRVQRISYAYPMTFNSSWKRQDFKSSNQPRKPYND